MLKIHEPVTSGTCTTVSWEYQGSLGLPATGVIWCDPPAHDKMDALNMALSVLLPCVAFVAGEKIELPFEISHDSADFWGKKLKSISPFFKAPMQYMFPWVNLKKSSMREGTDVALFWGGGSDSLLAACELMNSGVRPLLVHIRREEKGWKKGGCFDTSLKGFANHLHLDHIVVKGNFLEIGNQVRDAIVPQLRDSDWSWGIHHRYCGKKWKKVLAGQITQGFHMFFGVFGALPPTVRQIVLAAPADDLFEPYGLGFAFDQVGYRGLKMNVKVFGTKVQEYKRLCHTFPASAQFQKSCWSDEVQWCGKCRKCREANIMQRAVEAPAVPITKVKDFPPVPFVLGRAIATLLFCRSKPPHERDLRLELELSEMISKTMTGMSL